MTATINIQATIAIKDWTISNRNDKRKFLYVNVILNQQNI